MPYLRANANPDEHDVVWSLDIFQDTSASWFNSVANALIKKDIINKDAIDMPVGEFADIIFPDYLNNDQSYNKIKQEALKQYHNINSTNDDRLLFTLETAVAYAIQESCSDLLLE